MAGFVAQVDAEQRRWGERWERQRIAEDENVAVRDSWAAALVMAESVRAPETQDENDAWYVNFSFLAHMELFGLCTPSANALAVFPEPTYADRMAISEHVAVESGHLRFWRYMAEKVGGRDPVDSFKPVMLKGAREFHEFLARDWLSYLVGLHICGEAYGLPIFEGLMTWKVCPPEMVTFTLEDWLPGEYQHQFAFTPIIRRMLDDAPHDDERLALAARIEALELEGLQIAGHLGQWGEALKHIGVTWNGMAEKYDGVRRNVYEDRLGLAVPSKPLPADILPGTGGAPAPV